MRRCSRDERRRCVLRWVGRLLVVAYLAVVGVALLWPDGRDINRLFVDVYLVGRNWGVRGLGPEDYATLANLVAFLPLAFGLVVGWSRVKAWVWLVVVVALSVGAELLQRQLWREPSVIDVVLNSSGAVLGTVLGWWRVKVSERSDRVGS